MDKDDHYDITRKRKKLLTKTGFFFWIVIIVPIAIFLTIWFPFHTFFPNETQLMVSHSLNNKNEIEIIRKEDFPDPTLHIHYNDEHIVKTKLPDDISAEWENDHEASLILTIQGKEPNTVNITFN